MSRALNKYFKNEQIERILYGTAYLPDSGAYKLAKKGLERMNNDEFSSLWHILTLKGATPKIEKASKEDSKPITDIFRSNRP
jgi:hypothetical protein